MKATLYYLFLLSGLIPSTILLFLTLSILPSLLIGFQFQKEELLVLLSCLLGICGFIGLIRLISRKTMKRYILTIILLSLGIIGSMSFLIMTGGQEALEWLLNFEEPDEWFLFAWPDIVALIFIIGLSRKQFRKYMHEEN